MDFSLPSYSDAVGGDVSSDSKPDSPPQIKNPFGDLKLPEANVEEKVDPAVEKAAAEAKKAEEKAAAEAKIADEKLSAEARKAEEKAAKEKAAAEAKEKAEKAEQERIEKEKEKAGTFYDFQIICLILPFNLYVIIFSPQRS